MRILFIGDYSNLHACLAAELRKKGHEVTVVSDKGGFMNTYADIPVIRQPGIVGGFKYLNRLFSLLPMLKGYDVVQLINPNFFSLKPGKIKYFFEKIRHQNGSIFLTLAGDDYYFVKACREGKTFRFSEFRIGDEPTEYYKSSPEKMDGWFTPANRLWNSYLYEHIDGAMSVLPEYDMAAKPILGGKVTFTNLPIDLSTLPYAPLSDTEKSLKIFIGIKTGMEIQKGTARMLAEVKELEREAGGKVEVECVRNLPLEEYLQRMRGSHIVLDQMYAYSPATNALQAMALGRIPVTGGEPEYYEYVGTPAERPILSISPFTPSLKERLRELAEDPTPLIGMSRDGRKLVEKNNDVRIVAGRFMRVWER